ncbi:MAG: hypothetical protein V2I30_13155, partial [Erythrobacter sp.]|nr:hypothetical protein [Erythrobacter sp.]
MIPHIRPTLCLRNLANVSAIAAALALPPAAAAQTPAQSAFLDPGAIDEAVAGFTGVAAGEIGGA